MNKTEIWINPKSVMVSTILVILWTNITIGLLELFDMMWYQ